MTQFKPCPFCGAEPIPHSKYGVYPQCDCFVDGVIIGDDIWNKRAGEDKIRAELKRERELSTKLYLLLVDNPNTKLLADKILIDHDKTEVKK